MRPLATLPPKTTTTTTTAASGLATLRRTKASRQAAHVREPASSSGSCIVGGVLEGCLGARWPVGLGPVALRCWVPILETGLEKAERGPIPGDPPKLAYNYRYYCQELLGSVLLKA